MLLLTFVVGFLVLFGGSLLGLYVDWLWFGEVGGRQVFWKLIGTRWGLGLFFGLALGALTYLNLWLARRFSPPLTRSRHSEIPDSLVAFAREGLTALLVAASLFLGAMGGLVAAHQWDDWLRFRNAQSFGVQDPIFKTDIGFYVFQYPFLSFLAGWLFTTLLLVTVATAVVYSLDILSGLDRQRRLVIPETTRVHLSVLLGLAMLAKGWDYWLDRYGLLLQEGPRLFGAGYTDVHARLLALNLLVVVALIAAVGFLVNARLRALWLPALALLLMVVASVTVGGLYPGVVQRFVVVPDEQAKERPYIQHHLEATRRAYGLHNVEQQTYRMGAPLTQATLRTERPTLDNIRLWDYRVLSQTYDALQRLRDYYNVREVDIDRYTVNGRYRQVMLAPRELDHAGLSGTQRNWVNETLQFTHGYGLLMSAVNEADASGRPSWLISNLPLQAAPGLEVTRPQLYYGQREIQPVIARSNTPEFDYQEGGEFVTSTYAGSGGIPIGSGLLRYVLGLYTGEWNLVISDQVKPDSRLLLRRNIRQRLNSLAPFLEYDQDPYLVLADGRLLWVQDAYTVAGTYPYSEPTWMPQQNPDGQGTEFRGRRVNYIRNSVKATVDGYTGEVRFYAVDPAEPVLKAYSQAFPGLFRPAAEIPQALRAHLRYPEDLFNIQADRWTRFHVGNPDVFFARSDLWDIPLERLQQGAADARMQAYYVIMRLPGEEREEFALITPFKTRNGTTMPGWLVARCDGETYGQLRLYRFPTESQVDAPEQVDSTIQSDPVIKPQVALLNQQGSTVRYGNLLVLPVGSSLLYVKPLYLEATTRRSIPELKQVILAEKRGASLSVVMRPTLREALAALVGGRSAPPEEEPESPATSTPPGGQADLAALAREAEGAFTAAEQAQRAGNWAEYGRQLDRARAALRRLRAAIGTGER